MRSMYLHIWEKVTRGNNFLGHGILVRQVAQRLFATINMAWPSNSILTGLPKKSLDLEITFPIPHSQIGHEMSPKT